MRNDKWISQSRYYGDRHPRTMQEAFGPYATFSAPRPRPVRQFLGRHVGKLTALVFLSSLFVAYGVCAQYW